MTTVSELDLDLDVFQGPFDLLLAVLLREEVSLADVQLGEIVIAYIDHLDRAGEIDLESATEFLVLIAALLELKSRLLLPGDDDEDELAPEEAADELLARMLEYRRYRLAAEVLGRIQTDQQRYLYRSAKPPPDLRRAAVQAATKAYEPERLAIALGDLLALPPEPDVRHIRTGVSVQRRLTVVRALLQRRGVFDFDESFGDEDRYTQAVTLFALLELHKRGEASWTQGETFGPIEVKAS